MLAFSHQYDSDFLVIMSNSKQKLNCVFGCDTEMNNRGISRQIPSKQGFSSNYHSKWSSEAHADKAVAAMLRMANKQALAAALVKTRQFHRNCKYAATVPSMTVVQCQNNLEFACTLTLPSTWSTTPSIRWSESVFMSRNSTPSTSSFVFWPMVSRLIVLSWAGRLQVHTAVQTLDMDALVAIHRMQSQPSNKGRSANRKQFGVQLGISPWVSTTVQHTFLRIKD